MDKQQYDNAVRDQVSQLKTMADVQRGKCFNLERLRSALAPATAAGIRRVILTGCGDSYSAAGAILPGMKLLSGIRACNSPDIMDFCGFYSDTKICKGFAAHEVLLVAISFSGGSQRVIDALQKGNDRGLQTMLVTRDADAKAAQAAKYTLALETPDGCNTPGLRSYYASMVGLAALGAYLGVCRGEMDKQRFAEVGKQIADYTVTFMQDFDHIDDQMFTQAERMKNLRHFEVIADWNEGYSAQFVEQKFIECGGVFCDHTTSEEFAHISLFHRQPSMFGMVVMINEADPSLSRMRDTVRGCLAQHRPTVIVTDADPTLFDASKTSIDPSANFYDKTTIGHNSMAEADKPVVCRIAKAPAQWMSPFVSFIPGSLLAGYQAAVNEHGFFCGRYNFRTQTWQ
ncbi:MAG: hypothetical protein RR482_09520, partial [Clostridia bacterium]